MALSTEFQKAYDSLLSAWLDHEALKTSGSLAARTASRVRLDDLRHTVAAMAGTLAG